MPNERIKPDAKNPEHQPDHQDRRDLGAFAIEALTLPVRATEIPLPEGLRTKSGRSAQLLSSDSGGQQHILDSGEPSGLPTGKEAVAPALEYAQDILPDAQLSLLSSQGSSATIFEAGNFAVKVLRTSHNYTYVEKEAAAMALLHSEGLAPQMHALIDADEQFRTTDGGYFADQNPFKEVTIPRVQEGGDKPIIIMDKVDARPISTLTDDQRFGAFTRLMEVGERHDLSFSDVEIVADGDTGNVQVLDTGGMGRNNAKRKYAHDAHTGEVTDMYPQFSVEEFSRGQLAADLMYHLTPNAAHYNPDQMAMLLKHGQEADVRRFLSGNLAAS